MTDIIRNDQILNDVRARLHRRNQNWIALIHGKVGTGKSYAAIKIAAYIDPDFTIDQVVFNSLDLVNLVKSGDLAKGSAIVLDEAGISFGSRDFQTKENKQMSAILQTFRALNYALIVTLPHISFLDRHGRMISHAQIETININRKRETCRVKWKQTFLDWKTGDPRGRFPRVYNSDTKVSSITRYTHISKPSKELIKAYEDKKSIFLSELLDKASMILEPEVKKESKTPNALCKACHNSWYFKGTSLKPTCSLCKSSRVVLGVADIK